MPPWPSLAENEWTILGENTWTSLGENGWPILGENLWPIIVRKMTEAGEGDQAVCRDGVGCPKKPMPGVMPRIR